MQTTVNEHNKQKAKITKEHLSRTQQTSAKQKQRKQGKYCSFFKTKKNRQILCCAETFESVIKYKTYVPTHELLLQNVFTRLKQDTDTVKEQKTENSLCNSLSSD